MTTQTQTAGQKAAKAFAEAQAAVATYAPTEVIMDGDLILRRMGGDDEWPVYINFGILCEGEWDWQDDEGGWYGDAASAVSKCFGRVETRTL